MPPSKAGSGFAAARSQLKGKATGASSTPASLDAELAEKWQRKTFAEVAVPSPPSESSAISLMPPLDVELQHAELTDATLALLSAIFAHDAPCTVSLLHFADSGASILVKVLTASSDVAVCRIGPPALVRREVGHASELAAAACADVAPLTLGPVNVYTANAGATLAAVRCELPGACWQAAEFIGGRAPSSDDMLSTYATRVGAFLESKPGGAAHALEGLSLAVSAAMIHTLAGAIVGRRHRRCHPIGSSVCRSSPEPEA